MKAFKLVCGLLLSCGSFTALACEHPVVPDILSAEDIDEETELLTKADTLQYLAGMESYVACIQAEHEAAAGSDAPDLHLSLLATRNNAAVAEVEAVRTVFEERVGDIEELADAAPVNCIRGGPRASTRVIDNRNVLFYGRDGIFRNVLQGQCTFLRQSSGLTFGGPGGATNASRFGQGFCADQLLGGGGTGCRLGQFFPISASEAEALLQR